MSKREAGLFVLLGNGNPKTIESLAKNEEACRKVMELAKQHDFLPNKNNKTRHELERSLDLNNAQTYSNNILPHEFVAKTCFKADCSFAKINTEMDYLKNCKKELMRQEADLINDLNAVENMVSQGERHLHVHPTAASRSISCHPSKNDMHNDVGESPPKTAASRSISCHPSINIIHNDEGESSPNAHATQDNVKYVIKKGTLVSFSSSRFSKVGIVVASNECCRGCTGVLGDVTKHGGVSLKMEVEKLQTSPGTIIRCQPGNAVIVGHGEKNYGLLQVPYIIFAVAPNKAHNKDIRNQLLQDTYQNALKLAEKNKLDAVAFSLLGAGNRCTEQQKEEVIRIGVDALFSFTEYCNLKEVYHYGYNDEEVRHLIKICKEKL
jgi:O-acetyl-ADP-ribose deacetylase (regulator of RNase III)